MDLKIMGVIVFLQAVSSFHAEGGGLSYNFYGQSCPQLESIIRRGVRSFSLTDPTTPAALLRLLFHDCQVQGCDASILLDPDCKRYKYSEMASSKNFGIRKRHIINLIKSTVEHVCPQQVSCADILVLAAREAVSLSGGPRIVVPLGRRDSSSPPNFGRADSSLPDTDIGLNATLELFVKKAMTVEDSVAILGAHTLGVTHCFSLQGRLYNHENRPGNVTNPGFLSALRLRCPVRPPVSRISFVENDMTSVLFDNEYYMSTMKGRGVLNIDAEMALDSRTRQYVEKFAHDQDAFFQAFSSAFVKLSSSDVLTGNQGVIRRRCNELD